MNHFVRKSVCLRVSALSLKIHMTKTFKTTNFQGWIIIVNIRLKKRRYKYSLQKKSELYLFFTIFRSNYSWQKLFSFFFLFSKLVCYVLCIWIWVYSRVYFASMIQAGNEKTWLVWTTGCPIIHILYEQQGV